MKTDHMRYFLSAAKHLHFARAAKEQFITPSTMSHAMTTLEQSLEVKLFEKSGKQLKLTPTGQALMERVIPLLKQIDALEDEFKNQDPKLSTRNWSLACTPGFTEQLIIPGWLDFQKEYPRQTLNISSQKSSEVVQSVLKGQFDLGFCVLPNPHPDLQMMEVIKDTMEIVVRKGHPLTEKTDLPITGKELNQYSAALPKALPGIEVCENCDYLKENEVNTKMKLSFDNYNVALNYISQTDFWSFVPRFLIQRSNLPLEIITLKESSPMESGVYAIWPKVLGEDETILKLVNQIKNKAT